MELDRRGDEMNDPDLYDERRSSIDQVTERFEALLASINDIVKYLQPRDHHSDNASRITLLSLRLEAERVFRRYQLCNCKSDDDINRALWWFSENGNEDDLRFLETLSVPKERRDLFFMTLQLIKNSLSQGLQVTPFRPAIQISLIAILISSFVTLSIQGPNNLLRLNTALMFGVLSIGLAVSGFLFAGALSAGRRLTSGVCLAAAGLLLLSELATVLHDVVMVLSKRGF